MFTGTNATNPGSTPPSELAAPPLSDLNAVIPPALNSLMIGHTFSTLLLPLLIALFYFSTPQSRRQPIFILNVVSVIFAFTAGVITNAFAIHSILSPRDTWPPWVAIAIGAVRGLQYILVDFILLVRLISVHPPSRIGLSRFAILTSLPILLKIARIVNMIILIEALADVTRSTASPENIAIASAATPNLKFEWSAQMVDNAYASFAFLWTIRDRGHRQGLTSNVCPNRVTFAQRMHTLSYIALSNFLIPSSLSMAQLVVIYCNVGGLIINEIVLVNTMSAVFGVVFATVWAGNTRRREAQIDLLENASPAHDAVADCRPRAFSFPKPRTYVASPLPTLALGSTRYTVPTDGTRLSTHAVGVFDSEEGNNRGALVGADSTVAS